MDVSWRWIFAWVFIIACFVFILSIWSLLIGTTLHHITLLFYGILLFAIFLFFMLMLKTKESQRDIVSLFEKTLQGRLYHFKCPLCNGVFAMKESMYNDNKSILLTCPDCGHIGRIRPDHKIINEKIPEKKSEKVLLRCRFCGESIKIWAEGTRLFHDVKVFCCPYCGINKPMRRV